MGDDEMISVFNPPKQMTTDQKIRHIANHYGFESQSRQLMEECGELTQAVNKMWRATKAVTHDPKQAMAVIEAENNLVEEIADVSIMIIQIQEMLGIGYERITEKIEFKLDREITKINKEQGGMIHD